MKSLMVLLFIGLSAFTLRAGELQNHQTSVQSDASVTIRAALPVGPSTKIVEAARNALASDASDLDLSLILFRLQRISRDDPDYEDAQELIALITRRRLLYKAHRLANGNEAVRESLRDTKALLEAVPNSDKDFKEAQSLIALLQQKIEQAESLERVRSGKSWPDSDDFVTVLGAVDIGVTLYDKQTKQIWGIITAVPSWGRVTVARVDSVALSSGQVRGNAST